MTGYAYKEKVDENVSVSVEIKSWNSRFLDLSVNMPSFLGRLENRIREKNAAVTVDADENAAKAYFDAIQRIATACGLDPRNIPLQLIASQDGVLSGP